MLFVNDFFHMSPLGFSESSLQHRVGHVRISPGEVEASTFQGFGPGSCLRSWQIQEESGDNFSGVRRGSGLLRVPEDLEG